MNFLSPAYLWALTALAVPLAIHLLSRKEGKIIRMGSLRHVRETPTRQFRSIRLNEYLLLLLRMIILALLVFFMSGWYLEGLQESKKWMVVEPGLERRPEFQQLFDSLQATGYEWRWLVHGFAEHGEKVGAVVDYRAGLEELNRIPLEDVVVVATNRLSAFRGPRMSLPGHIRWIDVVPAASQAEVGRMQTGPDSVLVRMGNFNSGSTKFSMQKLAGKNGRARDTVLVILAYDPKFETDKEALHAVVKAIQRSSSDLLSIAVVPASGFRMTPSVDWVVWLSELPLPSVPALVYLEENRGEGILESMGTRRYRITKRLNSEVVVAGNLTVHLKGMLFPETAMRAVADSLDVRSVPMRTAFGKEVVKTASLVETGNEASSRYLLAALLFFLVLERVIAYRRNQ